ncbi:MAG: hypothetical protein C4345_00720 [Chloroflexota bacterium]
MTVRVTVNIKCNRFAQVRAAAGGEKLERAVFEGARLVVQGAKRVVPVRTGRLKRSIHVGGYGAEGGFEGDTIGTDIGGNESGPTHATLQVGTNVYYAGFVEFGTSKMRARPYLRPALDENVDQVIETIGSAFKRTLEAESCH